MGLSDEKMARLEEVGSTIIHKSGLARRIATRHILKLEEPTDILLRWRIGIVVKDVDYWARTPGRQSDAGTDPSRWPNAVLGVERDKWQSLLSGEHLLPAVVYKIGSIAMVGIRELDEPVDFTVPVNSHGRHDANGSFRGVAMRAGPGFVGAIGVANESGDHFWPLDTDLLARLNEVPEGLNRV